MQRDSALPAARETARPVGRRDLLPAAFAAGVSIALLLLVAFFALRWLDTQRHGAAELHRAASAAAALGAAEAAIHRLEAATLRTLVEPRAEDGVAAQSAAQELHSALDALAAAGHLEHARVLTLGDEADELVAAAGRVRELARQGSREAAARAFYEVARPRTQHLAMALTEDRRRAAAAVADSGQRVAAAEAGERAILGGSLVAVLALLAGAVVWRGRRQARARLLAGLGDALLRAGRYIAAFLASSQQYATGTAHQTAAIEEMAATIEDLSATARYVASCAERAVQLTAGSQAAVDDTVARMEEVQAKVGAAVARIAALGEQSRRVAAIADLISDIAGKTHLLSVNAAIEAVTAGPHGQRFAVVAGQVKELATETQEATAQVQTIVAEIRAATDALVAATQEAARVAEAGAGAAHRAGAAMGDVVQVVRTISNATQQQQVASQQVVPTMREVVAVARQSAEVSRQAAAEAQRLKETADELARLLSELERL